MEDKFVVYRDKKNSNEIRIHRVGCRHYVGRSLTTTQSAWDLFPTYDQAKDKAKEWKITYTKDYDDCPDCRPSD